MLSLKKQLKENLPFILLIVLMFSFRSSVADWYHVPSGSMEPNIQIGDRVVVDKMAYSLDVPFTNYELMSTGDIERGDIVIIDSHAAKNRLIKRVVAVEGDTVSLNNNRLIINGEPARLKAINTALYKEEFSDTKRTIALSATPSPASSFNEVVVPEGHILAMGDNRNNSVDSRYYGFFPISEVRGKATSIAFSVDSENYYLPRKERLFVSLE
ncbi:signal peptidase I [Alteromonas gracilis]|uniref:signal peptidase I n=1 Tax=Alteromonas gracilis TaxID=1479524 RepID=UPI0030CB20FE